MIVKFEFYALIPLIEFSREESETSISANSTFITGLERCSNLVFFWNLAFEYCIRIISSDFVVIFEKVALIAVKSELSKRSINPS